MPSSGPCSRRDLVKAFRELGWEGPFSGGKHEFMKKGSRKQRIPNDHGADISWDLVRRILKQADIPVEQWTSLS